MSAVLKQKNNFLSDQIYEEFRGILHRKSGIEIGQNKKVLLESRLMKRITETKCQTYQNYLQLLKTDMNEFNEFIYALTTNKTDWFREPQHFDFLVQQVLKKRSPSVSDPFMVWSAASSTGEEAYTIAMLLEENGYSGGAYRILGTDINEHVLRKATNAIYREDMVRSQVDPARVKRWFQIGRNVGNKELQVIPDLKQHCKFRQFNLQETEFNVKISFDVIFLRNVLIYFKLPTTEKVINHVTKYLKPGGYLMIGHSESLTGVKHDLKLIGNSIFQK